MNLQIKIKTEARMKKLGFVKSFAPVDYNVIFGSSVHLNNDDELITDRTDRFSREKMVTENWIEINNSDVKCYTQPMKKLQY